MQMISHGRIKYPASKLLGSSSGLGWSTISAEHRSHPACEIPVVAPQHVEISLTVAKDQEGWIRRSGAGQVQQTPIRTGAICLSPIGVGEDLVTLSAPIKETLHLYLPAKLFERLNQDFRLPLDPARSIRFVAGIRDEVIEGIGRTLLSELHNETAGGRVYVETASLTIAARLLQKYCDSGACAPAETSTQGLDQLRLRRVLNYIAENIRNDISLTDLAGVAGYSQFHFARMFALATGVTPHRYISQVRIDNAMVELAAGKVPLTEIAFNAQFSSQASFTRAFHRATGMTPMQYRRRRQ